MADAYIDHGAYASNIGAVPTWGVPQEGDGSATTPASASSIASVAFASVPTSGTISVCGITISTTGVIGAASADAAANALAANINAATTTVAASVAVGLPQLRNLVYARGPGGGAPAGTCQIMMRVGSASLNHASNTNVGIATTFSAAPTITQFAGGSGGCWGWLINSSAIGVSSSISANSYGLMVSTPMVWTATPTALDFVWARTGTNPTITLATGTHLIRGALGWPLNLVFDTNTKWTGDGTAGVVRVNTKAQASGFAYFRPAYGGLPDAVTYNCLRRGSLEIGFSAALSSSTTGLVDNCLGFVGRGIRFVETEAPHASGVVNVFAAGIAMTARLYDCDLDSSAFTRSNITNGPRIQINSAGAGLIHWIGGEFKVNLTGVPADVAPLVSISANLSGAGSYGIDFRIEDLSITTNSAYKLRLFSTNTNPVVSFMSFVAKNCRGLVLDSGYLGLQSAYTTQRSPRMNSLLFVSGDAGRSQRQECWNGVSEWNPDAAPAFPKLAATQYDGTVYSIRMYWLSTTAASIAQPYTYTSAIFNRLADGVRTITQEVALDTSRGIGGKHVSLRISYVDTSGIPRTQYTWGVDPVASSAPWTGIDGWANFGARKWVVTTDYSVKQNTMIEVEVALNGPPPGSGNSDLFIDPEPAIT